MSQQERSAHLLPYGGRRVFPDDAKRSHWTQPELRNNQKRPHICGRLRIIRLIIYLSRKATVYGQTKAALPTCPATLMYIKAWPAQLESFPALLPGFQ